jgi:hypothetical protein
MSKSILRKGAKVPKAQRKQGSSSLRVFASWRLGVSCLIFSHVLLVGTYATRRHNGAERGRAYILRPCLRPCRKGTGTGAPAPGDRWPFKESFAG